MIAPSSFLAPSAVALVGVVVDNGSITGLVAPVLGPARGVVSMVGSTGAVDGVDDISGPVYAVGADMLQKQGDGTDRWIGLAYDGESESPLFAGSARFRPLETIRCWILYVGTQ